MTLCCVQIRARNRRASNRPSVEVDKVAILQVSTQPMHTCKEVDALITSDTAVPNPLMIRTWVPMGPGDVCHPVLAPIAGGAGGAHICQLLYQRLSLTENVDVASSDAGKDAAAQDERRVLPCRKQAS
jgi:hypothetical protein